MKSAGVIKTKREAETIPEVRDGGYRKTSHAIYTIKYIWYDLLVQISSPIAVGLFACLQIAPDILAFGALFAGIHVQAHRRHFGVRGWQKRVSWRTQKYTNFQRLPCNRAMMHPPSREAKNPRSGFDS